MAEQGRTDRAAWEGEMFRLLAENVKDYAIFVVDRHRHVLSWSRGAERLLGFTEGEILGRQCDCFFTPEDVERGVPQKELEQALATGRGEDDRWHVRKDGSRFWASGAVTPLKDEAGRLRGFAKIMRDRTEMRLAEEATHERERQLQLLTDHAPVLIAHCDTDRRYKFVNRPYAALFGLQPREVVGRRIRDVLGGPAYAAIERHVDAALGGERVEFEVEIALDGRGPQVMRCAYDPEFDGDGKVEGFVAAIVNVTESRWAEAALAASRRRLQALFDNTLDAVLLADDQARYVDANPAACKLLGYDREELLRLGVFDITPMPNGEVGRSAWAAFVRDGHQAGEYTLTRRDGSTAVVEYRAVANVQPGLHLSVLRDVTDRKRTEEALRESERRFRTLATNAPVGIFQTDPDGNCLFVNDRWCEITGLSPEDAAGVGWVRALHPDDRGRVRDEWYAAAATGREFAAEYRFRSPQGRTAWVQGKAVALRDGAGATTGHLGTVIDTTEQRRAAEALRGSEGRLRAIIDNWPSVVFVKDREGRYLLANRACEAYSGEPVERMVGKTDYHYLPAEVADRFRADDRRVLETGEVLRYEESAPLGGELRTSLTVKFPLRDSTGQPYAVCGIATDITEMKRASEALRQSEERLRAISDNLPHGAVYQVLGDSDGGRRFLYVSAGVEKLFGVTPAEALADATALYGLVHEEDRARVATAEGVALRDNAPFDCEFRSRTRSGGLVWVHARSAPRPLPTGQVVWEGVLMDVTARKDAEAEIARLAAESERRRRLYEAALSNTPDLVYVFDLGHRFVYANEGLLRMWGKTWDEAIGKTCLELGYEPWHAAMHDREIEQVVATKQPIRGEVPFTGTFGRRVYDYIFVPVLGENGEVEAVAGTTRDVTERREAEDRYRTVLESITDAFFALGRDWRFTYVNRQAERVLDRTPGDLLGKTIWEEYPGLAGSEFERAYRRVMAERVTESVTAYYPDHDRWYEVHVYPAEGGISVYFRDVSDRVRSDEALRASEERFRTLFERMDEGYCVIEMIFDPPGGGRAVDYRFLEVNPAFEAQAGMKDATGRRMLEFVPSIEEHWLANYGRVALTGEPIRFANEYTGLNRWFEVYAFRVGGAGSRRVGVLFTDITRRKQAEADRERLVGQLRDADRRKDEFLATLAHELRNPLAPLRNGLQVMKLAAGDAGAVEQARGMMERQLGQMVRLVDDLLDVSRITRGKLQLRRERVDLASAVRSAVETARPLIEASAHELAVRLPPEPVPLDGDPTRLAQVFSNLLTNAAKYTDKAGRIALTAVQDGGVVVVAVKDTGIGIPPEHLPKLFEIFSQVDSALERSQGGLGIGLSLVKGLVEMHGGTVEARSDGPGRGSEFVVRLPVAGGSTASTARQPGGGETVVVRPRRRILVADDNRDAADSLAMMLRLGGHEVHAVHDGQEAVDATAWFRPDLALLDIGMPKLNGLQAAHLIREQPWGRQVVLAAITGWGQDEDKRKATEAGFDRHLTKPVDPAALDKLLASLPGLPG